MGGCFGLAGDPLRRNRPERVQETHPTLRAFELYQQGALAPNWVGTVDTGPGGCLPAVREPGKITVDGAPIAVRPHACLPAPVFGCPICNADRYKLYWKDGSWGCPACHGLDRASRRRHVRVRGYWRLRQLRRRIGAPDPFSPIKPRSIVARNFWRDVLEIRRIEASLAGLVADNASVLEKRHASKRRRRSRQPHL
jgi:hypothetical protein